MRTFIALGSNIGDRREYLRTAVRALPDVVAVSPVYETEPVGGPDFQESYLNCVVELDTDHGPRELLDIARAIEKAAHRERRERWAPRTLDVDLLVVGDIQMNDEDLIIPHPRMRERRFVLAPLRDLAPDLVTADEVDSADGEIRPVGPLEQ